jgi:hypothetical protein
MVSNRCKIAVKEELKKLELHFIVVDLGEVEVLENIVPEQREQLRLALLNIGFELMDNKKSVLVEKIKYVYPLYVIYFSYLYEKIEPSYEFTELQRTLSGRSELYCKV